MKKFVSLLLALMLTVVLAVSAFAADKTPSPSQTGENQGTEIVTSGGDVVSPQTGDTDPVWVVLSLAGMAAGMCLVVKKRHTSC